MRKIGCYFSHKDYQGKFGQINGANLILHCTISLHSLAGISCTYCEKYLKAFNKNTRSALSENKFNALRFIQIRASRLFFVVFSIDDYIIRVALIIMCGSVQGIKHPLNPVCFHLSQVLLREGHFPPGGILRVEQDTSFS